MALVEHDLVELLSYEELVEEVAELLGYVRLRRH